MLRYIYPVCCNFEVLYHSKTISIQCIFKIRCFEHSGSTLQKIRVLNDIREKYLLYIYRGNFLGELRLPSQGNEKCMVRLLFISSVGSISGEKN